MESMKNISKIFGAIAIVGLFLVGSMSTGLAAMSQAPAQQTQQQVQQQQTVQGGQQGNQQLPGQQQTQNKNQDNVNYIDSNIKITKSLLPDLRQAYNNVNDKDYKLILGKIINLVETKGVVNSDDIKQILSDPSLRGEYWNFFFSRPMYTCVDWCPGSLIPHIIRMLSFGCFLYWEACCSYWPGETVDVCVGPCEYTNTHSGLAISFVGFAMQTCTYNPNTGPETHMDFGGVGAFLFVKKIWAFD